MGKYSQVYLKLRSTGVASSPLERLDYYCDKQSKFLSISSGPGKGRVFPFEGIYDQDDPAYQLHRALSHLPGLFLDGFNVSALILGRTGSGKSGILEGTSREEGGLLAHLTTEIFNGIQNSVKPLTYTVSLQVFEVYGELVKDLLDPSKDGLSVLLDQDGPHIPTLTSIHLPNAYEAMDLLQRARVYKTVEVESKSILFYVFEAHAHITATGHLSHYSRFTLVDMCGTEKLLEDPNKLVMTDGQFVAQSIKSLWGAIKAFGSGKGTSFNLNASITTQLLAEEFGGNCHDVFILTMDPTDTSSNNMETLTMSDMLRRIITYPVCNEENALALFKRFRAMSLASGKALLGGAGGVGAKGASSHGHGRGEGGSSLPHVPPESSQQQHQHQHEEQEKLMGRVHELTERLNVLATMKAELEGKLARCEQERLELKKLHIESEISTSEALERADTQVLELSGKVLLLQQELVTLSDAHQALQREREGATTNADAQRKQHQEMSAELSVARANYASLQRDVIKLKSTNDSLNLHIVNLSNHKSALQKAVGVKDAEIERLAKHNDYLFHRLESKQANTESSTVSYRELEAANNKVTRLLEEKGQVEQRLIKLEAEFEAVRLEQSRTLQRLQEESKTERQKLTVRVDVLTSERTTTTSQLRELRSKLEHAETRAEELERSLQEREDKIQLLKKREAQGPRGPSTGQPGAGADIYHELQEYILETQQQLENERSALLTRCHVAEHQLEVLKQRYHLSDASLPSSSAYE